MRRILGTSLRNAVMLVTLGFALIWVAPYGSTSIEGPMTVMGIVAVIAGLSEFL